MNGLEGGIEGVLASRGRGKGDGNNGYVINLLNL